MTPEACFLLDSLRQDAAVPPASLNWDKLLLLAESHGVLPLFYRAREGRLPGEFVRHFHNWWARTHSLAHELEGLAREFGKRGIEFLPLKGPVLAEILYRDVSLRPSDDLDLLVRPEDFRQAEALLLELGFQPAGPADDYHRDFGRDGLHVELHFGITSPSAPNFDLSGAWRRAGTMDFHGHVLRVLSPVDRVLYLALHGLKHRFARLIWVLDLSRALDSLDRTDASGLLDEASAQHLRNVVLTSCAIARRSFGVKLPRKVDEALGVHPALVRQGAAIADSILATAADPTTSVHDASHYLQLADTAGRRWKQRLRFFLPTQQDYQWTARYHIHPRCAALVRPFRLLCKYGPAPALRTLFPHPINKLDKP